METITIQIIQEDVYEEVAKATDYTGSKLIDGDDGARDRILAADEDLAELGRFWEESVLATNENLKEMLVSGRTKFITPTLEPIAPQPGIAAVQTDVSIRPTLNKIGYEAVIEVRQLLDVQR